MTNPVATTPVDPGRPVRLLAAILGVLAAALVVTGSFLPQTSFEQVVDGKTDSSQSISAWSRSFGVEPGDEAKKFYERTHVARYGIPLTAGAAVLLAGAGLAFTGRKRAAAARTAMLAGGAGVAAAVWMLGMDVSATLSYESDEGTIKSHYATGLGFWLLLGAGGLSAVVLVLAALSGRRAPQPSAGQQYGGAPHPGYPGAPGPGSQPWGGSPGSQPYGGSPGQPPGGQPYGGSPGSAPQTSAAQPYGSAQPAGPTSQPFPAQPYGSAQSSGPTSQPYGSAQPSDPTAQPYPGAPSQHQSGSQPYPGQAQPYGGSPAQPYGGSQPSAAQPPGGPTSRPFPAEPFPQPGHPAAPPPSPTEPNYQLPPLDPPKT